MSSCYKPRFAVSRSMVTAVTLCCLTSCGTASSSAPGVGGATARSVGGAFTTGSGGSTTSGAGGSSASGFQEAGGMPATAGMHATGGSTASGGSSAAPRASPGRSSNSSRQGARALRERRVISRTEARGSRRFRARQSRHQRRWEATAGTVIDPLKETYNSCRKRHCPRCQSLAQARWVDGRLGRQVVRHAVCECRANPPTPSPLVRRHQIQSLRARHTVSLRLPATARRTRLQQRASRPSAPHRP